MPAVPALRRCCVLFGVALLLSVLAPTVPAWAAKPKPVASAVAPMPPVLANFQARRSFTQKNLPAIITAAEAVAKRMVEHPKALINVPYGEQQTFAEEILNRAGGLANALPTIERPQMATPDDVALLAVRAWDVDGPKMLKLMEEYKKQGWMIVLFASKKGLPKGAQYDYLIDNAGGPGEGDSAMNTIANVMNAWVWTCEYTAAMTRLGKYPGILQSMVVNGSEKHNGLMQSRDGRLFQGEYHVPIPAGELAGIYFRRVDLLIAQLQASSTQGRINRAAMLIAERLKAGKTVITSSCEHFLLSDIFNDNKTPWKPVNVVWRAKDAYRENVKEGDIIVFFGYIGLSTVSEDYAKFMRETKADIIASYIPDWDNPANNANEGLVVIEQHWRKGDGEVNIPFAPGLVAPISGLEGALIYRMLDDAAAAKYAAK
ncbi:MAG: hypothetical protein ACYC6A_07265 [Armatimonadota bacterium]